MGTTNIELNTGNGQVVFTTDKITGKLSGIIFDSDSIVEIIVESELGYPIFHTRDHINARYYAPRVILQPVEENILGFDQFDEYLLDEKLIIIIRGGKNKDVKVSVRYN